MVHPNFVHPHEVNWDIVNKKAHFLNNPPSELQAEMADYCCEKGSPKKVRLTFSGVTDMPCCFWYDSWWIEEDGPAAFLNSGSWDVEHASGNYNPCEFADNVTSIWPSDYGTETSWWDKGGCTGEDAGIWYYVGHKIRIEYVPADTPSAVKLAVQGILWDDFGSKYYYMWFFYGEHEFTEGEGGNDCTEDDVSISNIIVEGDCGDGSFDPDGYRGWTGWTPQEPACYGGTARLYVPEGF